MRKLILLLIAIIMAGCVAMPELPDVPTPTPAPTEAAQYLNPNPSLAFGGCDTVEWNEGFTKHSAVQCYPARYTLLQRGDTPIPLIYTGDGYTALVDNVQGGIGFTLDTMRLDEGRYLIQVYGLSHLFGNTADYWIQAEYSTPGNPQPQLIGGSLLTANGLFRAQFTLDAPARADYIINVFLWLQWASAKDNSYLQISRITVERLEG